MAKKVVVIVLLTILSCSGSAFGQTAGELREKYGRPVEAYSVSEHIWMTPDFTDDGQLC